MAKKSTYQQLLEAKKAIRLLQEQIDIMKGFTLQQSLDMACIALNNEFHFGPVYNARFEKAFRQTFHDYALLCVTDGEDDEEITYTKAKVDEALRIACGDDIMPFDERYAFDNLYFRQKLKEENNEQPEC